MPRRTASREILLGSVNGCSLKRDAAPSVSPQTSLFRPPKARHAPAAPRPTRNYARRFRRGEGSLPGSSSTSRRAGSAPATVGAAARAVHEGVLQGRQRPTAQVLPLPRRHAGADDAVLRRVRKQAGGHVCGVTCGLCGVIVEDSKIILIPYSSARRPPPPPRRRARSSPGARGRSRRRARAAWRRRRRRRRTRRRPSGGGA